MIIQEELTATLEQAEAAPFQGVPLQTFQRTLRQICAGEEPWIPIGNFMHQFFGMYKQHRDELVRDPLELPEQYTPEQLQWAAFCAASVEHLCKKYELDCPEWAMQPLYILSEPWYYGIGADLPRVQEKLRATTPEEFTRRNVFCGDRTYNNKYEHQGRQGRRRSA